LHLQHFKNETCHYIKRYAITYRSAKFVRAEKLLGIGPSSDVPWILLYKQINQRQGWTAFSNNQQWFSSFNTQKRNICIQNCEIL